MITLNDIPFDYLVGWAKANKSSHPELSYLGTLNNKGIFPAGTIWRDAEIGLPLNTSSSKLKTALLLCEDAITRDYADDNKTVVLPANASQYSSFYDMVRAFIHEYRLEMEYVLSIPSTKYKDSLVKKINAFRETYEFSPRHQDPTGRNVIADQNRTTRQRVDQYLSELTKDCKDCLSGEKVGRVVADPVFLSSFAVFRGRVGKMVSIDTFVQSAEADSLDGRTLEFLASVLDMTLSKNSYASIPVITSGLLGDFGDTIGGVFSYFRKEVIGIRTNIELKGLLNNIPDSALREALYSLILNSDEFIKYDDNGEAAVTLRWDYLQTVPARVCWILYEDEAFDYKTAIHETELVKKYNARAKLYGVKRITVNQLPSASQSGDCWKPMSLGKTGFWKIRSSKKEGYDFDSFIRNYLRKNGSSASFDDFLRIIADDGQYRLYNNNERSVRARYIKNGGVIAHLQKTQVRTIKQRLTTAERRKMKDEIVSILDSLGKAVTTNEVYNIFLPGHPATLFATFSSWVRELIDDGEVNAIVSPGGRTPTYLSSASVPTVKPRSLADEIVDKTLEIINGSTSSSVMIGELYSKLKAIVPDSCRNKTQVIRRALHNDSRIRFEGPVKSTVVKLAK